MAGATLKGLTKSYGETQVLRGIDLDIRPHDFTVFLGPSGCGKSTTLRLLAGLETRTSGEIWIGTRNVSDLEPRERDVAMVFQNYALYPNMTIARNMGFGLKARRMPRPEIDRRVTEVAAMLGLTDLLARRPGQLSGGQQQRVAIGRAIVREPALFLFDEPLSNLDARLRIEMRDELLRLHRKLEATTVYVTHDQEEAMTMADRIVVMNAGAIEQVGTPSQVYFAPASRMVAGFVGSPSMNMVAAHLDGDRIETPLGTLAAPEGTRGRGSVTLGVRPDDLFLPEALEPGEASGTATFTTELVELLGARGIVSLRPSGQTETVFKGVFEERHLARFETGRSIDLAFARHRLHVFGADGMRLGTPS